jgi:starch synthase
MHRTATRQKPPRASRKTTEHQRLKIVITAPEAIPFAKVGGLGDVAGTLPKLLAAMGHEVILVIPKYQQIEYQRHGFNPFIESMGVRTGSGVEWCKVHLRNDPAGFRVFLIEHHVYFSRPGIYDYEGRAFHDNGQRFAFLCMAVLQLCRDLNFFADVIHCHDWPTALIPALLKTQCGDDPVLGYTGSVLTIHNLAHQGKLPSSAFAYAGFPPATWNPQIFEDHGQINFLKGGIVFADVLNTVSPTYAREILSDVGGAGLHRILANRQADLHGILNGVDYNEWSPERDAFIPAHYSRNNLAGKKRCKAALQKNLGLKIDPQAPLCGVVARFTDQKGIHLVAHAVDAITGMGGQLAVLGTGEKQLEDFFRWVPSRYPGQVGSCIGFDNNRAHLVEAGSDLYLMPSLFEPCGLNQIYALRYGTIPVVRATGGLEDTVSEYDPVTGTGTGFKFHEISLGSFIGAISRAIHIYLYRPRQFAAMQKRAMAMRFTWEQSVERYLELYQWAIAKRKVWR